MSTIETILSRAMSDAEFAEILISDPEQALAGYELAAEERDQIKSMSLSDLSAMTGIIPEERKSMVFCRKAGGEQQEFNHNETALKVCKGTSINHNQSILKVR